MSSSGGYSCSIPVAFEYFIANVNHSMDSLNLSLDKSTFLKNISAIKIMNEEKPFMIFMDK